MLTVAEGLAIVLWHRMTGSGIAPLDTICLLLPGAFLMLALRHALTGAGWVPIAAWLLLALVAHIADLRRRWR